MSALTETLCDSYSMHGINVEVVADDPAVLAAMEYRLRRFAGPGDPGDPTIRFEFRSATPRTGSLITSARPVYETPHGTLYYSDDDDLLSGDLGGVTVHCRPGAGRAVITAPSFHAGALYFATHPVATVALMEMMERLGRFSLHAACLAEPDGRGLLLSGPSGAGKSTLTLALARAGMGFLGDDVVFLSRPAPHAGGPLCLRALGFDDAIGVGAFAAGLFPERKSLADEPPANGFPKRLHRSEALFGREPTSTCEPRALVFPEVAPELPSALTPIDRGEALVRLVPDVLSTHGNATRTHVAAIAELLGQVRCYTARSGHDLDRAADMIRAVV
jgi:hypothetical protein